MNIRLEPLRMEDEEQFILDNQAAFNYGAQQYFDAKQLKGQHEEEGQIIARETILNSIHQEGAVTYRVIVDEKKAGGIILHLKDDFGDLEIFFVVSSCESRGVGQASWKEVERLHPEIKI